MSIPVRVVENGKDLKKTFVNFFRFYLSTQGICWFIFLIAAGGVSQTIGWIDLKFGADNHVPSG